MPDKKDVSPPEIPPAVPEAGAAEAEAAVESEATKETLPTAAEAPASAAVEGLRIRLSKPKKHQPIVIPQVRDAVTRQVETIMEEGLKDAFQALTPIQKQEFKIKGEETSRKIRDLLRGAHIKVKKIFRLLLDWLKLLPGVNRFFLEQEAKIKADRIIGLKHYDRE